MSTPALATDIRGAGRHYTIGDTPIPSVTNITGLIKNPTPLMIWAAEQVLTHVCDDPDSWLDAVINDPDEAIRKWKMRWQQKRDDAADAGTAIHEYLEALVDNPDAQGEADKLSPDARRFLNSADTFLDTEQPSGLTEVTLVSDNGYAGTADLIGTLTGRPRGVIDYKTRKRHDVYEGDILQLAALRHATHQANRADDGTVQVDPIDPIEHAYLVTFTPDDYHVWDLTDHTTTADHEAFLALRTVRLWEINRTKPKKGRKK